MKITNLNKLKLKKLIVFDMDGTLTESKSALDPQMASLLGKLLANHKVAVISGGKYGIFRKQFLPYLKADKKSLGNLFLFPVTGTAFYKYKSGWKNVYAHYLSTQDKAAIRKAFADVLKRINYEHPKKVYGKVLEDRKSQMSFSALGQEVVAMLGKQKGLRLKEEWRRKNTPLKLKIAQLVGKELPHLEVRAAGFTTIDITKKGIDKAYGLKQMEKYLKVKIKDMLFVGDAIFPGGNDYAITKTSIDYIPVKGPEETKKIIGAALKK